QRNHLQSGDGVLADLAFIFALNEEVGAGLRRVGKRAFFGLVGGDRRENQKQGEEGRRGATQHGRRLREKSGRESECDNRSQLTRLAGERPPIWVAAALTP